MARATMTAVLVKSIHLWVIFSRNCLNRFDASAVDDFPVSFCMQFFCDEAFIFRVLA